MGPRKERGKMINKVHEPMTSSNKNPKGWTIFLSLTNNYMNVYKRCILVVMLSFMLSLVWLEIMLIQ